MTVLFVANNANDFVPAGSLSTSTDSAYFNSTYVSDCLFVSRARDVGAPMNIILPTPPANDLWLHFCLKQDGGQGYYTNGVWMKFYDDNNVRIADLYTKDQDRGVYTRVYGDSTVSSPDGYQITTAGYVYVDIHVNMSGGNITLEFYVGGVLINSATAAYTSALLMPNRILMSHNGFNDGVITAYSEIMVADENTIGWHLCPLTFSAGGNYDEWEGAIANINDGTYGTRISADAADLRQSWLGAYNGPTGGSIREVINVASHANVGDAGPQTMRHYLRINATDYDGDAYVPDGFEQIVQSWAINPDTGVAWTEADLASLELGVKSEA